MEKNELIYHILLHAHAHPYTTHTPTYNNNNGNFYSALPIKNFTAQGTYKSNTMTRASSFKNYSPPKFTYKKAKNQTIGASFAHSLPTRSHTGAGHMQFYRRKSRVST